MQPSKKQSVVSPRMTTFEFPIGDVPDLVDPLDKFGAVLRAQVQGYPASYLRAMSRHSAGPPAVGRDVESEPPRRTPNFIPPPFAKFVMSADKILKTPGFEVQELGGGGDISVAESQACGDFWDCTLGKSGRLSH